MSKNALAKKAGVPQSQVSNWSRGIGKRFTENAKKVVETMDELSQGQYQKPIPEEIESAVRVAWNGDPKRAKLICDVLNTLERYKDCA
ncbi:hypothetical protein [Pseudidiomarina donghaiensis]|uniref:Uncharacterized protein n=1 Tax=Pseudidiomarina donghaiensis TaxID=519452 RepID=A0A432XBU0_9GAMM|nr:hypothetical protein [Pseudidiomarina donghaiensis]RUO46211.1 hypothetical protein CWE24_11590 [Pseudidiomarina donghaiensis]